MSALTEQAITHPAHDPAGQDAASRMTALVEAITGRLDAAGIPWCLLRNRDLVPEGLLRWSDLDVMVPTSTPRARLIALMQELSPAQIVPFRDGLTYMFFPFDDFFLRVDFFHGEDGWLGAHFSDTRAILAQRWNDDGLVVAAPLHQAYLTWCNRLVRGGTLPERYHPLILEELEDQPEALHSLFADTVGPRLAGLLIDMAASGRLAETSTLAGEYKRCLWRHAMRQHPIRTAISTARTIGYGLARRIRPAGLEIEITSALPGLATDVVEAFTGAPSRCVPGHGVVLLEADDTEGTGVGTVIRAWRRHLIGHRGMRARMDFLFSDAGMGTRGGRLGPLLPSPDIVIVLDPPLEGMLRAIPGLTRDEAERWRDRYRSLATTARHGHLIDANQPVDAIMRDTVAVIREVTTARTRHRYGDRIAAPSGRA